MNLNPDWEFYSYINLTYPRFFDREYTSLTFTDYRYTFSLLVPGYHELPSPGELSKLAIAPTPSLIVNNGIPELSIRFIDSGALLRFGRSVYQCRVMPHNLGVNINNIQIKANVLYISALIPALNCGCNIVLYPEQTYCIPPIRKDFANQLLQAFTAELASIHYNEKNRIYTLHLGTEWVFPIIPGTVPQMPHSTAQTWLNNKH